MDSTPEYGVRTVGFHILLYINIIAKQHVRSPVTLNVTSGVVNALGCVLGISNICHRTGTGYADGITSKSMCFISKMVTLQKKIWRYRNYTTYL